MERIKNQHHGRKGSPLPGMLLFELLYKVFIWVVVQPLFRFVLNITLTVSGYQLAFNDFTLGFLLTVPGVIAAVVLLALSSLFTYIEFAVLITLSGYGLQGKRPSLRFLLRETRSSLRGLAHPSTFLFSLYILGLLPIVGMGFSPSLLPGYYIPNFITGELRKTTWGNYLLLGLAVLIFLLFLASLFTMPVMVLQKCSFGKAFVRGLRLTRRCGIRLIGAYAGFLLLWGLLAGLPQLVFRYMFGMADITFAKIASVYGFSWQSLTLMALLLLSGLAQLILLPLLLHHVVRRYGAAGGEIGLPALPDDQQGPPLTLRRLSGVRFPSPPRPVKWTLAGAALLVLGYGMLRIFNDPPGLHPPIVVGHRGSAYGVENTLEALQGAIDAGTDYAEVDILLSADGVPMVIHDTNLGRLTGESLNVYDLTAEELQRLTLMQNGYTGKIPTLEEVIRFCRGKTGLAVEIKLHGHEQGDVVEKTMTMLQQNQYLEECIFLSLEYDLVEDINTRYPEATAGYCVYVNVGSLNPGILRTMKIDFVVIEESMVSSGNLYDLRGAWLPVYVWTVNDRANMQRYLELGVNGFITDYPDVGAQTVEEYLQSSDAVYLDEAEWKTD